VRATEGRARRTLVDHTIKSTHLHDGRKQRTVSRLRQCAQRPTCCLLPRRTASPYLSSSNCMYLPTMQLPGDCSAATPPCGSLLPGTKSSRHATQLMDPRHHQLPAAAHRSLHLAAPLEASHRRGHDSSSPKLMYRRMKLAHSPNEIDVKNHGRGRGTGRAR
jgi:hypothetical protein